jgi:hypothetical protein
VNSTLHFDFSPIHFKTIVLRRLRSFGATKTNLADRAVILGVVGVALGVLLLFFRAQPFSAAFLIPSLCALYAIFGFLVFSWSPDVDDSDFKIPSFSFPFLKIKQAIVTFALTFFTPVPTSPPRFRLA